MNKVFRSILLEDKQRLSVGELIRVNYTYIFTLLYLVFVSYFITILWVFTCDFFLIGDTWVKGSKRRQNRTKWAENKECWCACRNMTLHHTNCQEQHAAAWSFCAATCYVGQIEDYWGHATACQNHAATWRPWLENFIFGN